MDKLEPYELILLILAKGPVRGKTALQKQFFIAYKEIFSDLVRDPLFHPDRSGPFSELVEDSLLLLRYTGYVNSLNGGEEHQTFYITEKGLNKLKEVIPKIPAEKLDLLSERKKSWDEWTKDGILNYVYREFPEYFVRW